MMFLTYTYPPACADGAHVRFNGSVDSPPLSGEEVNEMIKTLCNEEQWEKFQKNWDADFSYQLGEKARFRINAFNQNARPLASYAGQSPPRCLAWRN